jgi:LmbE family N-acetylglucosaminyl deacetylase
VTAAFYLSDASRKLYYTAFPKGFLKVVTRIMPLYGADPTAIGRNKDINLVEISQWETPVHARIDTRPWLEAKEAASRAHVSQYGGGPAWAEKFPAPLRRRLQGTEAFTRAWPPPNGVVEHDLFAGV